MSYITDNRLSLEDRHYVTDATSRTHFYNFWEGKLREYIHRYRDDFCLVINGSAIEDDAYVLPFKDFKDFFSHDFLDANHRWIGNVRDYDEVITISAAGKANERFAQEYHNAFHLLQDAPPPHPERSDLSKYI